MKKADNLQQINTNNPRETLVFAMADHVIKRPVPGRIPAQLWLEKQHGAKKITDELLAINNPAYFIPRIENVYNDDLRAVEQRVNGMPLSASYFATLSAADQDIIYNALAHFINDMNQMRPVMTQAEKFDARMARKSTSQIIAELAPYIDAADLQIVTDAKSWFDNAAANDASVVFSHGDMNENNIFYDPARRTVSFIDFADTRYENINYMFDKDFGKLYWLDMDRLRREYMALPRKQKVIIKTDPNVEQMRNALQNFNWTASEFLRNPDKIPHIRIKMIQEAIEKIQKLRANIITQQCFARGATTLKSTPQKTPARPIINNPGNQK